MSTAVSETVLTLLDIAELIRKSAGDSTAVLLLLGALVAIAHPLSQKSG
jgi:hypothetical protein